MENTCVDLHTKNHFFNETMVERMVRSNSSSSNMHGVINDNSNRFRSMVMDAMRMNECDAGEFAIVDEESNVDATRFFELLKDSNKPL
jgi:hypothetical protein